MAVRASLRAVGPGDLPAKAKPPMSLIDAVEAGDYLGILIAQRREIAESLPDEKGPAKAALHRQLSIIAKEIEGLVSQSSDDAEGGANVEDGEFNSEAI
jgi:hypothetical protein